MKKYFAGLLLTAMCFTASAADEIRPANTINIDPTDSPETILLKAANVVPTPNQLAALEREFIAFVHFGPNTFTRMEWGTGKEDPAIFALENLDTDQWVKAMKDAGIKMVIFTAKHHDGFVLWQSRYTRHGIMSTKFRDGKGDVLRDLAESCRKYGMKLGIYLSPADLYQIENPEGLYGNLSKPTMRTIPRPVEGRPFSDKRTFQFEVDDYNEYFLNQLFELLTEYGPVDELWFDGAHPKRKGNQQYNYAAWDSLIHTLAPKAAMFGRGDIRWCGNEAGATRDTEFNVRPIPFPAEATEGLPPTEREIATRDKLMGAKQLHYCQPEVDTSIREGWFYRDDNTQKVRSADDVFDIYERSVGGNATLLLNIPPNREGLLPDRDVEVLAETGRRIRDTYGTDLLKGAEGPAATLDGDKNTFVEVTEPLVYTLPAPVTLNRFMIQEAIATKGERVEEHVLDAWIDGQWKEIARATNIGYKRILRFPDVTTDRLRLRVTASRAVPAISHVSAHRYDARPPQLDARRDTKGMVTIEPRKSGFAWKTLDINSADNLSAGYTIHYTTDGSTPDANSPRYTAPFAAENATVKAVALLNGMTGAMLDKRFGIVKNSWEAVDTPDGAKAFDESPATVWTTPAGSAFIIDLGTPHRIAAFSYTPPTATSEGMIARGTLQTSADGKKWTTAGTFEFGNLVNDPTTRLHTLAAPVTTRFFRIVADASEGGSKVASIAEIDLFE